MAHNRTRHQVETFLELGAESLMVPDLELPDTGHGPTEIPSLTGTVIGSYRMLEPLGEGGMSIVYLAERMDGHYDEKVAVKLLRHPGPNTGLARRFHMERQILARLDHPHIARILDGGVSDDGWPYLIMEYVEGKSLVDHAHQAPLSRKLSLFRDVCSAVQHAHRHLIVHRDLKPSNILVTADGTVKLLDFGIAKLIDGQSFQTDVTLPFTGTGLRLMTPEYAAPEQIRGQDITTSTDVYALGVLFYELLSGQRPYRLADCSPTQVEKLVCVQDPPAPGSLDSDLDTICLKALRKEPDRRYAGAGDLAADLDRYVRGFPIEARPATVPYRLRKFISRNRVGVMATSLIVGLSLAFGIVTSVQMSSTAEARDQARAEATRSGAMTEFMLDLFRAGDPRATGTDTLQVRDLLARGVERADQLSSQPDLQADMLLLIGRAYTRIGQFSKAEEIFRTGLALQQGSPQPNEAAVASTLTELANNLVDQGRLEEAAETGSLALQHKVNHYGPEHPRTAMTMSELGSLYLDFGHFAAAESLLTGAVTILEREHGDLHPDVLNALNNLAGLHLKTGQYRDARDLQSVVLERQRQVLGPDHFDVATSLNNLAVINRRLGEIARAEELYRESLALKRRIHDGPQQDIARSLDNLGVAVGMQGRYDEAEEFFLEALHMREELLGANHPSLGSSWNNLSVLMARKGDHRRAAEYGERAVAIARSTAASSPKLISMLANLAISRSTIEDHSGALQAASKAIKLSEDLLPADHPDRALALGASAQALLAAGRYDEALGYQSESRRLIDLNYGDRHPAVATAALRMSRILFAQGQLEGAEDECSLAVDLSRALLGDRHPRTAEALHQWAMLRAAQEDTVQAVAALEEALAIRSQKFGVDSDATRDTRHLLDTLKR